MSWPAPSIHWALDRGVPPGHYCRTIDEMTQFVDRVAALRTDATDAAPKSDVARVREDLDQDRTPVPRDRLHGVVPTKGNVAKTMEKEAAQINTWWNQNCTDPMMEVPASFSPYWSGLASHATFSTTRRTSSDDKNFIKVIKRP